MKDPARVLLFGATNWTDKEFVSAKLSEAAAGIPMDRPLRLVCMKDSGVASIALGLWCTWVQRFYNLYVDAEKHSGDDSLGVVREMVGKGADVCVVILDDDSSEAAVFGAKLAREAGIPVLEFAAEKSAV